MSWLCAKMEQVVKVIWHEAASLPHVDGSVVFARWRQCAPHIQKAKNGCHGNVPWCRISAISAFCRLSTQTPLITNCLVAIVHTKPIIAILVPKLVAMTTSVSTAGSPSNTRFLRSILAHNPNGISIGVAVFAVLTSVTDRQTHWPTDHATQSVTIGRIYSMYVVLRCGLIITK